MSSTASPPVLIWQPEGGIPGGTPISNPPVYSQADVTPLVAGQAYVDVVFGSIQTTTDWVLVECDVVNTADLTPLNIWPGLITNRTTAGFRVYLNGLPDTANYYLHWAVSGVNIAPVPATLYLFTGPTSGAFGVNLPFTVKLPPSTILSAPITVTPDDGGAGGTFSPPTVTLSNGSATATFVYNAVAYGAVTLSVTNSGTLIDPAPIVYTSIAPTYTFTGPSGGVSGVPSTNFTVQIGADAVLAVPTTITPHDGGGGGTFTPTSVLLVAGVPVHFTYTPASGGAKTISVTNDGGLTNPGSLSYSATVPFSPTDIAGLKLWLKADALALSDGAAVATWTDSSGLGNDATQPTSTFRPIFKTNIVNGKPILRFDGVDDSIGANMLGSVTTSASIFLVQKTRNITSTAQAITSTPTFPTDSFAVYVPYSDSNIYFDLGDSTTTGRVTGAWGGNTTDFFVWSFVAGGGNMSAYRNGTVVVSSGGHTNIFSPAGETLTINGLSNIPASQDADIAEVLIYNTALTTTDRVNVENYLRVKYALP